MRILVLSDTPPHPGGFTSGGQRSFQFIRRLADEHEFTIAYVNWANQPEPDAERENRLRFIHLPVPPEPCIAPPFQGTRWSRQLDAWRHALLEPTPRFLFGRHQAALQAALAPLVRDSQFDIVHPIGFAMLYEVPPTRLPIVADWNDVISQLVWREWQTGGKLTYSVQRRLEYEKVQWFERRQLARVRALITVSELDRERALRLAPRLPIHVLPISADLDFFQPQDNETESAELVFTGTMNYRPNVDAMLWFCREILPRVRARVDDVHLSIVGANPSPEVGALASKDVIVTGSVPDVRPYMAKATVVIVPLQAGGGARTKIVEAWAMEKAVISTSVGAEGLDGEHLKHLWIADEPNAFSNALVQLLGQPGLRRALGGSGRQLAERRYSLAANALQLDAIYRSVALPHREQVRLSNN